MCCYFLRLFVWHLRSGPVGVQVRVKMWQKSACLCTRSRVKKRNQHFRVMFRVKACQSVPFFLTLQIHSNGSRTPRNGSQGLTNPAQQGQKVSNRVKKTLCFWRVSKRVKTCQKAVACQNVSTKCHTSVKNLSKRCKTCQKNTAVQCFVSKRVKNTCFWYFLTLFSTLNFVF